MFASRDMGAERKMLKNFVLVGGGVDDEKESWVARVLFSCRWFMKEDTESEEMEFLLYLD